MLNKCQASNSDSAGKVSRSSSKSDDTGLLNAKQISSSDIISMVDISGSLLVPSNTSALNITIPTWLINYLKREPTFRYDVLVNSNKGFELVSDSKLAGLSITTPHIGHLLLIPSP